MANSQYSISPFRLPKIYRFLHQGSQFDQNLIIIKFASLFLSDFENLD